MKAEKFQTLLDELDGNSLQTLKEKNARYSQNGDCLHNFRSGAELTGRTPAQTCWGYMSKHLTALRDMVEKDDFSDREDFLEKCQDIINYIRFLWCIGNDSGSKNAECKKSGYISNINADKYAYGRCVDVFRKDNEITPYKHYVGSMTDLEVEIFTDRVVIICPELDECEIYDFDGFYVVLTEGSTDKEPRIYTFGK